jgi:Mn2+/Fe2+ NRAMP family transporter
MDVVIAFAVFLGLHGGVPHSWHIFIIAALAAGWAAFIIAAMRRGCLLRSLMRVSAGGVKDSLIVVGILLISAC